MSERMLQLAERKIVELEGELRMLRLDVVALRRDVADADRARRAAIEKSKKRLKAAGQRIGALLREKAAVALPVDDRPQNAVCCCCCDCGGRCPACCPPPAAPVDDNPCLPASYPPAPTPPALPVVGELVTWFDWFNRVAVAHATVVDVETNDHVIRARIRADMSNGVRRWFVLDGLGEVAGCGAYQLARGHQPLGDVIKAGTEVRS